MINDPEYISGVMSLRRPQTESLRILDKILNTVKPQKNMNLETALLSVNSLYPTCKNFERNFMSLTFALATGVGKTRLMGAFIAYLYTNHNVRDFFVTAPNTTIFEKLKRDLGEPGSPKYVFNGLSCFNVPPEIFTEDDYRTRQITFNEAYGVRIFIYNIDKFNREDAKMKRANEILGESFYNYLSSLNDLVLIMDESHHYRAERGMTALNELKPVLGLELTATPIVNKGNKQILFENVVYEYPLSKAIEDGYTRTPFATARADINAYNFGDEELDKIMLNDGILLHEDAKAALRVYAASNNKKVVKPFMLVVCKDTEHAEWVKKYLTSDECSQGSYKNKTLVIHSKQKGAESDENMRLLMDVENPENPIEIVIHVNMLKEGWDVNNLYTIVPLRTAVSRILREQMVGRGLRLPYGERTGDSTVDSVKMTAHDKFTEILEAARKGDSIFKAGNVIKLENLEKTVSPQLTFTIPSKENDEVYKRTRLIPSPEMDRTIDKLKKAIQQKVEDGLQNDKPTEKVIEETEEEAKDIGKVYHENAEPLSSWVREETKRTYEKAKNHFIPIPLIRITSTGVEDYGFDDFDLELSEFNHAPIGDDKIIIQNLINAGDKQFIKGGLIDFGAVKPIEVLLTELYKKPEVDYEKASDLALKLVRRVCEKYNGLYGSNGLRNIVMMNKHDIVNGIYNQMLQHLHQKNGFLQEEVFGNRERNIKPNYKYKQEADLYDTITGNISSILFTGIKKGVFSSAKFDSYHGELTFARLLESDKDVQNWLRPSPLEFNITYGTGKKYEPDFVVETDKIIYLTEVKGRNMLNDPDVQAKKERGIKYCEIASRWGRANGFKDWKYLFIPADEIKANSTFGQLAQRFDK